MANVCEVCGKDKMKGNKVSHSNRKTIKHFKPNIQTVSTTENGNKKSVKMCTKCVKTQKAK